MGKMILAFYFILFSFDFWGSVLSLISSFFFLASTTCSRLLEPRSDTLESRSNTLEPRLACSVVGKCGAPCPLTQICSVSHICTGK